MASRTKQKEEARARRLAEERARLERDRRQRRLRKLSGIVLGAVIVIVVAVVISTRGGSSNSTTGIQKGAKASKLVAGVTSLLGGIPESGAVLGNPSAPVTMTYYGDLECPICRDFTLSGGFPQLISKDVRAGKVKVVYKAFETATPSPTTFNTQQVAALAAGQQNKFWYFTELFYQEQGQENTSYVTESYLDGLARQVPGLSLSRWKAARSSPTLSAQIQADGRTGNSLGVNGTPTLIFSGPHGKPTALTGVPTYSNLESAVKSVS